MVKSSSTSKDEVSEDEDLWSIASRERIASLPRVSLRALLFLFLIAMGIAIPWAIFFQLPIIATAKGKLEPSGRVFELDAPLSGVITQVDIMSGQKVKANQKLLNLDPESTQNKIEQIKGQITTQQNQLIRLRQLQDQERNQLSILQSQIKSQNAGQQSETDWEKAQIAAKKLDLVKAQLGLSGAKKKLERYRKAQLEGALSQDLLENVQQVVNESEQNLVQAKIEITQAESNYQKSLNTFETLVSANEIKVSEAEKSVKKIESEIASVSQEIRQLEISVKELNYQLNQRTIRSPTNGEVFDLTVAKPGSVVEQGELLISIAPQSSRPIFRGEVKSKDSGFLKVDMIAKVKLDSYSWREYGVISGKVIWISPTTYTNKDNQEVYQVEIELEPKSMSNINLSYGQIGQAEILVKQKRIINYWLN